MEDLSLWSRITLYILIALFALLGFVLFLWQIKVLRGDRLENPDGSADCWRDQETHFGIAFADIAITTPCLIAGLVLVFLAPRWGHYLLNLVAYWQVWTNTMTTVTSLRFHNPKLTLMWFVCFPFSIIIALAYILWTVLHFGSLFCS